MRFMLIRLFQVPADLPETSFCAYALRCVLPLMKHVSCSFMADLRLFMCGISGIALSFFRFPMMKPLCSLILDCTSTGRRCWNNFLDLDDISQKYIFFNIEIDKKYIFFNIKTSCILIGRSNRTALCVFFVLISSF